MAKQPSLANLALKKGTTPITPTSTPPETGTDGSEKRKGQTLRLTPGAWKQLKHLATDLGKPAHDLLLEAVNDLFTKYGKPPIA